MLNKRVTTDSSAALGGLLNTAASSLFPEQIDSRTEGTPE
jgi:hypothetical protein